MNRMKYNGGCIPTTHQCSGIARHSHSARSGSGKKDLGMLRNKTTQSQKCSHQYSFLMNNAVIQHRGHLQRVRSVQQPSQGKEEEEGKVIGGDTAAAANDDDDAMGRSMDKDVGSTVEGNGDAVEMDSLQQQKLGGGINATTVNKGVVEEESLFQGVLEEVGLIQWPTVSGALLNTLLVIGIVFGTSLVLLAVNTGLAELSRDIYSKL